MVPQFFLIAGCRIAYETFGSPDCPPVLFVHGWMSHRGVWRGTVAALQDRFHCIAVDLLGFGDSDKPADADYGISAQGWRVLQLADVLGLKHFTLIGHSMGGQIALCTASTLAPQRVERLVSVGGLVTGRLSEHVEHFNENLIRVGRRFPGVYRLIRPMLEWRWFAYGSFRSWFYRMDSIPFEEWKPDRDMGFRPEIAVSAYKAGKALHSLDLTPALTSISCPTLAIHGKQDGTVPVSDVYLVKEHVPGAQLVLIDRCGHFPMYEQKEDFLAALREFLKAGSSGLSRPSRIVCPRNYAFHPRSGQCLPEFMDGFNF